MNLVVHQIAFYDQSHDTVSLSLFGNNIRKHYSRTPLKGIDWQFGTNPPGRSRLVGHSPTKPAIVSSDRVFYPWDNIAHGDMAKLDSDFGRFLWRE